MISFNPNNASQNIPPATKEALITFAKATEVFFGTGKAASQEIANQINIELRAISEGALQETNPLIQQLAYKLLEKIQTEQAENSSLSSFLTEELLLKRFTLSANAKKRIQDVPLEGLEAFIPLLQECKEFLKREQQFLGEGFLTVDVMSNQWIKSVIPAENKIILSPDRLIVESKNILSVQPDPSEERQQPVKLLYTAVKIITSVPREELEEGSWDSKKSKLESRYKVSKFFNTKEEAQAFFSLPEDRKELLPLYKAPHSAKEDMLSILQTASAHKGSALKMFTKDFTRLESITLQEEGKESLSFSKASPDKSTEEVVRDFQEHIGGEKVLSQIGDLLSQTVWANLIKGLQQYDMYSVDPSQYDFESLEREEKKILEDEEISLSLLPEEQTVIHDRGIIENSCLIKVRHDVGFTEEFLSVKLYINPETKEVIPFVSKLFDNRTHAKEALAFMQAEIEHPAQIEPVERSGIAAQYLRNIKKASAPDQKPRSHLTHSRVEEDIKKRIDKLDEAYDKDAKKSHS